MASLRRLPSGKWQATVRLPSGRRVTKSHDLRRVVGDWAREEERRIARGQWTDARTQRITFGQWHERWWAARVVEPETRRGDESVLRLHILPEWSAWQLGAITPMEVQRWVRQLEKGEPPVGAPQIRRTHNTMRTIMEAAVVEELIDANPCQRTKLPHVQVKEPAWFTHDQAARLLAELDEPHRTMTDLMLWTGLRWGEAAGLRGSAVDWLRGTLTVQSVMTQSGREKPYPKTASSWREVPVPGHVLEAMGQLMAGRDRGALVFVTRRQARPLSGANWRVVWDRAIRSANERETKRARGAREEPQLLPEYSPHSCRHTAASWLVQAGVPLYDVTRLLGHSSTQTTQRYAHLQPGAHAAVTSTWKRMNAVTHQERTRGSAT